MSILNVWISSDSALIACDSASVSAIDGWRPYTPKIVPLAHMQAVIGARGSAGFLMILSLGGMVCGDFDELLGRMPGFLVGAYDRLHEMQVSGEVAAEAPIDDHEVIAVGWSRRDARIIGFAWHRTKDENAFSQRKIAPYLFAPWDESIDHLTRSRVLHTPETMEQLSRAQLALIRERHPQLATGGTLITARIAHDSIEIRHRCEL